jgi:transposase
MILTFPNGLIRETAMLWQRGKAYGQDLRERVFAAADIGTPVGEIAEMLLVSTSYVSKALSRRARTGETTTRPQRCHVPPKLAGLYGAIRKQVASTPDATLEELKAWLIETHGVEASTTLIWETLDKLDLTLKKSPCTPPNKIVRTSCRLAGRGGESAGKRS